MIKLQKWEKMFVIQIWFLSGKISPFLSTISAASSQWFNLTWKSFCVKVETLEWICLPLAFKQIIQNYNFFIWCLNLDCTNCFFNTSWEICFIRFSCYSQFRRKNQVCETNLWIKLVNENIIGQLQHLLKGAVVAFHTLSKQFVRLVLLPSVAPPIPCEKIHIKENFGG